ncbi:MAG TPA: carbon-nitrogen hydrolase family protein [bacterium]|nr:carbon-nitrogen hydrolase family protein [bacterium]
MTAENNRTLNIALIQFHRRLTEQNLNLELASELVSGIEGADIVCFPEVWYGAVVLDESQNEEIVSFLGGLGAGKGAYILSGGLFVSRGGRILDVCHVIGPDGGLICEQQKNMPSGAVGERRFCDFGSGLVTFDCRGVRCGVQICVDLYYPEMTRELALSGAELVFNPANIPENRRDTWHSLVRTRAGENTVFVAYVNNTNTRYRDGREVMGGSLIAGPDGNVLAETESDVSVIQIELCMDEIGKQRERWPYLDDVMQMRENGRTAPGITHYG